MSNTYKEYKSIRVPIEIHQLVETIRARQNMRYYKQNPGGAVTVPGRATMGGIITIALELLQRQMDIEDGVTTREV